MKKIILLAALAFIITTTALPQQAVVTPMKAELTSAVDSVRSNGTTPVYLYVSPKGQYTTGVFQATVTRVSTAIGGTITMQGSLDGTNWYNATNAAGDTLTIANSATQSQRLKVPASYGLPFYHYRLAIVGVSNDTMTVRAKFAAR